MLRGFNMDNANKQHGKFNRVEKPLNIIDRISNDRCNPINFLEGFQLGQSQRTVTNITARLQ